MTINLSLFALSSCHLFSILLSCQKFRERFNLFFIKDFQRFPGFSI